MRSLFAVVGISFAIGAIGNASEIDGEADARRREQIASKKYEKNCQKLNKKFAEAYAELFADYPVSLLCRVPPQYPEECMDDAKPYEAVGLIFDVDPQGFTQNIRVSHASNECLIEPAVSSLLLWKFEPSSDGATDLETEVTFELS